MAEKKRRWLKWIWRMPLILLLVLLLLAIYGRFIEPKRVKVKRVQIQLTRLPQPFDGLTMAQLSDLHFPDYLGLDYFRRVVQMTNDLHPDIIVLTGDLVPGSAENVQPCADILRNLHAPLGVFAIMGNHDQWAENSGTLTEALGKAGIKVLVNESTMLTQQNTHLWVVGLDDYWAGNTDPEKALRGAPDSEAKILLMHEPDYADFAARNLHVDLQLSGHSHGGQVRLPFYGGLHYPPYSGHHPLGLYHIGSMQLYTNPGVGVIVPIRINCRPEITLFTLHTSR